MCQCASCDIKFVIKTNPKEMTYDYVEGLRKMEQDFVPDHDDSIIEATSDEVRAELVTNPMFRLQVPSLLCIVNSSVWSASCKTLFPWFYILTFLAA